MKRTLKRTFKWGFLALLILFLCKACLPAKQEAPVLKPRSATQYWHLRTGSTIAYTFVAGKGTKKPYPIIYLHGGPGGYVHSRVIAVLGQLAEQGYDVYLYDQIGCGLSARLDNVNEYTATRHQRDLEAIVETLKAEKVILVGQSWGGALATLFVADNPRKVDKLILTCPGAIKPVVDSVEKQKAPDSLRLQEPLDVNSATVAFILKPRYLAIRLWAFGGRKLASDEEADSYLNKMAAGFTPGLVCDPAKVLPEEGGGGGYCNIKTPTSYRKLPDPRPKLRNSQLPVLVIKGQCDNIPWGNTKEYLDIFRNSQLRIIKQAGHDAYIEQPDDYLQAIKSFLQ